MGFVRASFRGDCGSRTAGGADAGGAVWICAGISMDIDRSGAGGLRAGFYRAGGFGATQGEIAGGRGADGSERVYGIGGDVCGAADFAGDAGGVGSGGGECAVEQSVGRVHDRDDDSDCDFHGAVHVQEHAGTDQGGRAEYDWRGAVAGERLGRTLVCRDAVGVVADIYAAPDYLLDGDLRICGVGAAGVAVAGAAGLFVDVCEAGDDCAAGGWRVYRAPGHQVSGVDAVCARRWADYQGHAVSVFVRDDRVRRDFRISFAGEFGDDAEDAEQGVRRAIHRLWSDGGGEPGGGAFADRGLLSVSGGLFRN